MDRINKSHIRHVFQHLFDFDNKEQLEAMGLIQGGVRKEHLIRAMKVFKGNIVGIFPDGDIVLDYQIKESEKPNHGIEAPKNILITEGGVIPEPPKPPERPPSRWVREDGSPVNIIDTMIPVKEKRGIEYYLRLFLKRCIVFPIFCVIFPVIYIAFIIDRYENTNSALKEFYTELWEMD